MPQLTRALLVVAAALLMGPLRAQNVLVEVRGHVRAPVFGSWPYQPGDPVALSLWVQTPPTSGGGDNAVYDFDAAASSLDLGSGAATVGFLVNGAAPIFVSHHPIGEDIFHLYTTPTNMPGVFMRTWLRSIVPGGAQLGSAMLTEETAIFDASDWWVVDWSLSGSGMGSLDFELEYFIIRPPGEALGQLNCGTTSNSAGAGALLEAWGSALALDNFVTLEASELPPSQFGMFLNSLTPDFVPGPGGQQGTLCLGGSIGRYRQPGEVQAADDFGRVLLGLDLPATPTPTGFASVMAGERWYFQCWYRDANPGPTSNFSESISVVFQ